MGTTWAVRVVKADPWAQADRDRVGAEIQAVLDDVESKMSHYDPASELSRFNRRRTTRPFPVSADTFEVFREARRLGELTGGALDVTVAPLVNAWGFGPVEPDRFPPDGETLSWLRRHVGYARIELDAAASTLRKTDPAVESDLSAVAKGYGVDRVAGALRGAGLARPCRRAACSGWCPCATGPWRPRATTATAARSRGDGSPTPSTPARVGRSSIGWLR